MAQETIYVDCPCCGARLEARRDDGKVMGHWTKLLKKEGDPIKAAAEKLKAEKERHKNLLSGASAMIEEQKRRALEKFDKERERVERENDTSRPPSPFDLD
ncbi:MAG: hypothetical protein FD126_3548 [Elusimicrobia bacterium]|nr:MAG: hypothetical protein FD126_3548 [Elusimicrobiota bacterium]